jgi:tetratricopeptide (TPR) repeat protein
MTIPITLPLRWASRIEGDRHNDRACQMGSRKTKKSGMRQIPARGNVVSIHDAGLYRGGEMGVYSRHYPPESVRRGILNRIEKVPEAERSADEWWQYGEFQVLQGLSDEDDGRLNAGMAALLRGTQLNAPSVACLMDLGWVMVYKGLDVMAVPYLEQAVTLAPESRDAWSLLGWAAIGAAFRDKAIDAFARACQLRSATRGDQELLAALKAGDDLKNLRRGAVLRKFDDELFRRNHGDPNEVARAGLPILSKLHQDNPADAEVAYGLAYARYVLGQYDRAEPLLHRLIGESPAHADALTLLGLIATKRGDEGARETFYRRAVEADPEHVLANTNLGSLLQDREELHAARPFIERAINAADADDPYLGIALDLLATNVGMIEQDYAREAELHERAIQLDPKRPAFRANLIVALISAGRAKDGWRAWRESRDAGLALPNEDLLHMLFKIYLNEHLHPYECLAAVDALHEKMGWKAMRPLVERAWRRRHSAPEEGVRDFMARAGMVAAKAGANELALRIWREGAQRADGAEFATNVAVELSHLGRHAEALEAAGRMPMTTKRSYTVLGNIRGAAGQYRAAMEAYRAALVHDERFLLPIANAVDCARRGYLGDELDPFIERLVADWDEVPAAQAVKAQALVVKGEWAQAAAAYERILCDGDRFRTPEEIYAQEADPEDLSIFGAATAEHHYGYAEVLLALGRLGDLVRLHHAVTHWPAWRDGDWTILLAEALRRARRIQEARVTLEGMKVQSPPLLTAALCCRDEGDVAKLDEILDQFARDIGEDDCRHPAGAPGAVFAALRAERLLDLGNCDEALRLAREAVVADPTAAICRQVCARALGELGQQEEQTQMLREGLKRLPANTVLLGLLIEDLIERDAVDDAEQLYNEARPILERNGFALVRHQLGEQIALSKCALRSDEVAAREDGDLNVKWPWVADQPDPIGKWLRAASIAHGRRDDMLTAEIMYLSKVAEYLLVNRVFDPFRAAHGGEVASWGADQYRDIAKFLDGGNAPAIGGMARVLRAAEHSYRSSEEKLVTVFREFLISGAGAAGRRIRHRAFVERLTEFGRLRNGVAHLQDADANKIDDILALVVNRGQPGLIFEVFEMEHI